MWMRSGDRSPTLRRCLSLISITIFGGVSPVVINERPKETKTQWQLREAEKRAIEMDGCAALLFAAYWLGIRITETNRTKEKQN